MQEITFFSKTKQDREKKSGDKKVVFLIAESENTQTKKKLLKNNDFYRKY